MRLRSKLPFLTILLTMTMLAAVRPLKANTITVDNATSKALTFTFQVSGGKSGIISVEVPPGSAKFLGGKDGAGFTKGIEVTSYKLVSTTASAGIVNLTSVFGEPSHTTQFASILVPVDNTSAVYLFFDYLIPNYQELVANANFNFAGLNSTGAPILVLASNPMIQITDSSGNLLPQYQFTAPTESVGRISISTPEPSTLMLVGMGSIGLISEWRRRRNNRIFRKTSDV